MNAFSRFPPRLQEAIATRLNWTGLRPVQESASHALLDGKNAIVLAPTAGGKTEAAVFPMLARLMEKEPDGVGLLYIAPLKALLNNQADRLDHAELFRDLAGVIVDEIHALAGTDRGRRPIPPFIAKIRKW